jgi:nucleotide-binding universal stress UspA family protein
MQASDIETRRGGLVLVAYDGSEPAKRAVMEAGAVFAGHKAIVFHAWASPASDAFSVPVNGLASQFPGDLQELHAIASRRAEEVVAEGVELARRAGLDAEPMTKQAGRTVWLTIVEAAEERDAVAVVLGSRGLSGVKSALLGSVSTGVVHHCRRPVLVVP